MIRKYLDSLEDPRFPLMAPNIWALKKLGFLLPKNIIGKVAYILMHEFGVLFVLSQYVELYLIKSNLDDVITNLKFSMLSVVCVVKANTFLFSQKYWIELIDFVTAADKYERDNKDEVRGKILDSCKKYCRKITYYYWVLVMLTVVIVSLTPLVRYLSSSNFREEIRNGTEGFPHIFSSYIPFDKNHSPGNWLTVIFHVALGFYGSTNMCAYDTNVVCIMVFFGGQFDILRERCRTILGSGEKRIDYKQALDNIRQVHSMHVRLTKYFRLFNSLLSPVMFFYVAINSLMLCAGAYQFTIYVTKTTNRRRAVTVRTKMLCILPVIILAVTVTVLQTGKQQCEDCCLAEEIGQEVVPIQTNSSGLKKSYHQEAPDTFQKFLVAEFLFFGIAQLFMFCWHSNIVLVKTEAAMYGPYESAWWCASVPLRKAVVLLQGQLRIPHQFTAGPFTNLSLSTFLTILKGSYSYYTLLRK